MLKVKVKGKFPQYSVLFEVGILAGAILTSHYTFPCVLPSYSQNMLLSVEYCKKSVQTVLLRLQGYNLTANINKLSISLRFKLLSINI